VCSYLTFTDPRLKRSFRLPLVHIRLTHKGKSFRTDALVDSGATGTFLPIELMNILGFNLTPVTENPPTQPSPVEASPVLASAVVSSVVTAQGSKEEKQQAVGAGGIFGTYKVKIDLIEVLKGRHNFCSLANWMVLVPDKEGAIPHAVLGRDSIFRKFDVTYRENKEEVVFRRPKR